MRLVKKVLIVDLDVHQGDGTAAIFKDDPTVFTFSMHCQKNFPFRKEQSDLDIELSAGTGDADYLEQLAAALPQILDASRPDIVLLQGGADVLDGDSLGDLRLTPDGLVKRDAMVIDACRKRNIPVVQTLGGGYGKNAWWAQYCSIRRTLEQYGAPHNAP